MLVGGVAIAVWGHILMDRASGEAKADGLLLLAVGFVLAVCGLVGGMVT
jgi:hypothetical protein